MASSRSFSKSVILVSNFICRQTNSIAVASTSRKAAACMTSLRAGILWYPATSPLKLECFAKQKHLYETVSNKSESIWLTVSGIHKLLWNLRVKPPRVKLQRGGKLFWKAKPNFFIVLLAYDLRKLHDSFQLFHNQFSAGSKRALSKPPEARPNSLHECRPALEFQRPGPIQSPPV